jgi:hypothetical protein
MDNQHRLVTVIRYILSYLLLLDNISSPLANGRTWFKPALTLNLHQ